MWFAVFVGGIVRMPAIAVASTWVGLEFLQAVLLNEKVMVAHWAHVGGFAGGLGLTTLLLMIHRGHPEAYALDGEGPGRPDRFDEKSYIPEAPIPRRPAGFRLVATQWQPLSGRVRKIVDGVAPGSGAFSTPSRLAAGLAAMQADDLRGRLERAGYPVAVLPERDDVPEAPLVFLDRLEVSPDGIAVTDGGGLTRLLDLKRIVLIQAGTARGTPILDIVTRDPWLRHRLSGATSAVPVVSALAALKRTPARVEESVNAFDSLGELDDFFRWRLQRAA
jgi:hypothetical protein